MIYFNCKKKIPNKEIFINALEKSSIDFWHINERSIHLYNGIASSKKEAKQTISSLKDNEIIIAYWYKSDYGTQTLIGIHESFVRDDNSNIISLDDNNDEPKKSFDNVDEIDKLINSFNQSL